MNLQVDSNTVRYILCMQFHTPGGYEGTKNAACGQACENIHSWISLVGDLEFSHQGGIYDFKFPKKVFWGSLPQISLFYSFPKLKHPKSSTFRIDTLSFCIRMAQCHPSSQAFSQFIRPSSSLSYTSKTDCILKYLLDIN
jgi:hypothetical protein